MFNQGIRDTKRRVEEILAKHPKAREDDQVLLMWYWITWDGLADHVYKIRGEDGRWYPVFDEAFIKHSTPAETISRLRRRIQNDEHKYLPTPRVQAGRKANEIKYRNMFSQE